MPRPKERKRKNLNKRRHWLNEFEQLKEELEGGRENKGKKNKPKKAR